MTRRRQRPAVLALLLIAMLVGLLAGCGGDSDEEGVAGGGTGGGGVSPGSRIRPDLLKGARVSVGSKEFTEQLVLGQITVQALREAGATVQDRTGIKGSEATRKALTSGDIDMYWEYTGTAQLIHLGQRPTSDASRQYTAVADADKANGISWLDPAPGNNAYGIAARRGVRRDLDVRTLSEYAKLVKRSPRDSGLCVEEEFRQRPDGLAGLERTYGLDVPDSRVVEMQQDAIYSEIAKGGRCTFGEIFLTDGRLTSNELYVLEDDKKFSTTYNPALNVRSAVLAKHPKLKDIFNPIAEALESSTLRSLNAEVDVSGRRPDEVARGFLDAKGFIG